MSLDNYTSESELLNGLRHSEANRDGESPPRGHVLLFCAIYTVVLFTPWSVFTSPLPYVRITDYRFGVREVFLYEIRKTFLSPCIFSVYTCQKNNISVSDIVHSLKIFTLRHSGFWELRYEIHIATDIQEKLFVIESRRTVIASDIIFKASYF
jgi:hypothetical protein